MDWGTAAHVALLEPDRFASAVLCGPADRRGKKWGEFLDANPGKLVLPEPEFDRVVAMQNTVMQNPTIRALTTRAGVSEASALWIDPDTQLLCRCRPDRYVPSLALAAELKTTTNASAESFARTAEQFGYDLQSEFYTEGWARAGGGDVEDFIFIAVERDPPFAHQIFQFDEPERNRGRQIMRKALLRYAECVATGVWSGYSPTVSRLKFGDWVHQRDGLSGLYTDAVE